MVKVARNENSLKGEICTQERHWSKANLIRKYSVAVAIFWFTLQVGEGASSPQTTECYYGNGEGSTEWTKGNGEGSTEWTKGNGEGSTDRCPVPLAGLSRLSKDLQRASMDYLSEADTQSIVHGPYNLCSSLVAYLSNQASYLLKQAKLLTDVAMEDRKTFEILRAEYEGELTALWKVLENVKNIRKEDISSTVIGLSNNFTEFQKNIQDALDPIETLIVRKRESISELCVSQIQNKDYKSAFNTFRKLGDNSQLTKIVIDSYGNDIDKLSNVIKFIKIADSCEHQASSYQALFDIIKRDNHSSHPNVMFFSDLMENCASDSLKNEIEEYKVKTVRALVYEYKLEKTYEALEFEKRFPSEEVQIRFSIYSILFGELERNDLLVSKELLALAYRVKLLDDYCKDNSDDCKHLQHKLTGLKQKFPDGLQTFLFADYVLMESKAIPGYFLYGGNKIYTATGVDKDPELRWEVKPLNDSYYFEIENIRTVGKLCLNGLKLLISACTGEAGHWQLIPEDGEYYYLKNRGTGEVMDAGSLITCSGTSTELCSVVKTSNFVELNSRQLWRFSKYPIL